MYKVCSPCCSFVSSSCFRSFINCSVKRYSVVCRCSVCVQCEYNRCPLRCGRASISVLPFFERISLSFFLCISDRFTGCYRFCCGCCVSGISGCFSNRINDFYCFIINDFALRQVNECCCPGFTLISGCSFRFIISCSVKRHRIICCFSVCVEREYYCCSFRCCCASICVLPFFGRISFCFFLLICDRFTGFYRFCCRCCVFRISGCFSNRINDLCCCSVLVLRQMYEVCSPGCSFMSSSCFRSFIHCSIKRYSIVCCCSVSVQCEYYCCAFRCCCASICVLPCFGRISFSFFLRIRNRFAGFYRICCGCCVTRISGCFSYCVNDLCCCSILALRKVNKHCCPGCTLISACACRCSICFAVKCYCVVCCCSVCVQCEYYCCPFRCCCASISVLPRFLGIGFCFFLCICDCDLSICRFSDFAFISCDFDFGYTVFDLCRSVCFVFRQACELITCLCTAQCYCLSADFLTICRKLQCYCYTFRPCCCSVCVYPGLFYFKFCCFDGVIKSNRINIFSLSDDRFAILCSCYCI